MITLTSLQKLKPMATLVIIIGIVALLLLLIFVRYSPKKQTFTQPDAAFGILPYPEFIPQSLQHKVGTITVNLQNQPDLPPDNLGKVYQLVETVDPEKIAADIASTLDLTSDQIIDQRFLSWSQDNKNLTLDRPSGRINFSAPFAPPAQREISKTIEAEQIAKDWLTKVFLLPQNATPTVTPLKTEGLNFVSEPDSAEAAAYEVDFFENLDNFPLYGQSPRTGTITTIIDSAGQLLKLQTRLVATNAQLTATYPLKSLTDAASEVITQGTVVETEVIGVDPLIGEILTIKSLNLTSLNYAYFRNIEEKYIIPIYVLRGNLELEDGRTGEATVYLPAIQNQYLKF